MLNALSTWLTFDPMGRIPGTHSHGLLTPPFAKGGRGGISTGVDRVRVEKSPLTPLSKGGDKHA